MAKVICVLAGNGERVICDLQEIREDGKEDGKPICLLMIRPYTLNLEKTPDAPDGEVQVRFNKWLPYSSDTQFRIPFTALTACGAVDAGLEEAYVNTVAQAVALEQAQVEAQAAAAETGFVPADETEAPDVETAEV
jgi:hypothetical protein